MTGATAPRTWSTSNSARLSRASSIALAKAARDAGEKSEGCRIRRTAALDMLSVGLHGPSPISIRLDDPRRRTRPRCSNDTANVVMWKRRLEEPAPGGRDRVVVARRVRAPGGHQGI